MTSSTGTLEPDIVEFNGGPLAWTVWNLSPDISAGYAYSQSDTTLSSDYPTVLPRRRRPPTSTAATISTVDGAGENMATFRFGTALTADADAFGLAFTIAFAIAAPNPWSGTEVGKESVASRMTSSTCVMSTQRCSVRVLRGGAIVLGVRMSLAAAPRWRR